MDPITPPIMAPINRGPIWAIERMNPPAAAIALNKGIPVKLEAIGGISEIVRTCLLIDYHLNFWPDLFFGYLSFAALTALISSRRNSSVKLKSF